MQSSSIFVKCDCLSLNYWYHCLCKHLKNKTKQHVALLEDSSSITLNSFSVIFNDLIEILILCPMVYLKQPVALKKTSGSTISLVLLPIPSHHPEKGTITRSVRTGRASCIRSSFSSSVEDRFQSNPGN